MRRAALVGIAISATAVIAAGVIGAWVLTRPASAEDAARAYLSALSTGDETAISAMLGAPGDPGDNTTGMFIAAFAAADAYVENPRIEEITAQERLTTVRASADLHGTRRELHFVLSDAGGEWFLAADYLASLEVRTTLPSADATEPKSPAGDSVWIGEVLVPAGAPQGLLPAGYLVEAAPRGLLLGSASVSLSNDHSSVVQIDTAIAPEAVAVAQEQLDAYADACTEPASAVPDHCGIRVPWAADLTTLTSIAYRIDAHPTLALSTDARTFAATDGVLVATAIGVTRDGATAGFTYRADDWALRGSVKFEGDEMVLAVG